MITALDHVRMAMPAEEEEGAQAFYPGLLGGRGTHAAAQVQRAGPVREQAGVLGAVAGWAGI